MLTIRLARHGRRNHPTFRVVLQEKDWSPASKVLETLGHVNTLTNPRTVNLKTDRIQYWLSQGAQTSATIHNLLVDAGVVKGDKRRVVFSKKAVSGKTEQPSEATPTTNAAEAVTEATTATATPEPAATAA